MGAYKRAVSSSWTSSFLISSHTRNRHKARPVASATGNGAKQANEQHLYAAQKCLYYLWEIGKELSWADNSILCSRRKTRIFSLSLWYLAKVSKKPQEASLSQIDNENGRP